MPASGSMNANIATRCCARKRAIAASIVLMEACRAHPFRKGIPAVPDEKTACRTPAEGRDGVTNIPTWKFDCIRTAILDELKAGDCLWSELIEKVRPRLTDDQLAKMGKLGWHVISVKLELEVRGEIARKPNAKPQMLTLT